MHATAKPQWALVLAHGAGAGQKSPFMVQFALGEWALRHINVVTFISPISRQAEVLNWFLVLEQAWRGSTRRGEGHVLGCHLSSAVSRWGRPDGVAPRGRRAARASMAWLLATRFIRQVRADQRRDVHLPAIAQPMLFVQGLRDAFGTSTEIAQLLPSLRHAELHEVAGGDRTLFKVLRMQGDGLEAITMPPPLDLLGARPPQNHVRRAMAAGVLLVSWVR